VTARLLLLLLILASPARAELLDGQRWVMGTRLRIVLDDQGVDRARACMDACFAEAERVEALLSDYDPRTPLSVLNDAGGEWTPIPAELQDYLERGKRDHRRTDGVFDPTVGTWIRGRRAPVSTPIGMQHVEIEGGRARLPVPLRLDPGGDGKGVAVDAMVAVMRARGVRNAFVDFGGSSWFALGTPPEGEGWRVILTDADRSAVGTVLLRDEALSVSSSLQWVEAEGGEPVARPHLFDPRSGEAVFAPRSVAVVGPSATDAEVLSTAVAIAGVGPEWLERFPGARVAVFDGTQATSPPDWIEELSESVR